MFRRLEAGGFGLMVFVKKPIASLEQPWKSEGSLQLRSRGSMYMRDLHMGCVNVSGPSMGL